MGAGDGRSGAGGDPERHRPIRTFGKDLRDQRDAPSVRASPRRGKRGRQRRVGELCLRMAMGQQSPKPRIPPRTAGGAEAVLTEHTIRTSPRSPISGHWGSQEDTEHHHPQSITTHRAPSSLPTFWGSRRNFKARNGQNHPHTTDERRVKDAGCTTRGDTGRNPQHRGTSRTLSSAEPPRPQRCPLLIYSQPDTRHFSAEEAAAAESPSQPLLKAEPGNRHLICIFIST